MTRTELLSEIIKNMITIKTYSTVEDEIYMCNKKYKFTILPYETKRFYSNLELYKIDKIDNFNCQYCGMCNIIIADRNQQYKSSYIENYQLSLAYNCIDKSFQVRDVQHFEKAVFGILDLNDEEFESKLFQIMLVHDKNISDVYEVTCNTVPLLKENMEVHLKSGILEADISELSCINEELKNYILSKFKTIEENDEI